MRQARSLATLDLFGKSWLFVARLTRAFAAGRVWLAELWRGESRADLAAGALLGVSSSARRKRLPGEQILVQAPIVAINSNLCAKSTSSCSAKKQHQTKLQVLHYAANVRHSPLLQ